MVEFALVLPVFLLMLLGMLTGGIAFDRKLNITAAARETARYGATLPLSAHGGAVDPWLDAVATIAIDSADGALDAGTSGRRVCVAYIGGGVSRVRDEVGASVTTSDGTCFADGRPAGEVRIQVVTERTSELEAMLWSRTLNLTADAVSRYEATP
ncbi:MAG: TadE/TadG family type IV pilus assembly protein [Acidimicrobiales bacterium]